MKPEISEPKKKHLKHISKVHVLRPKKEIIKEIPKNDKQRNPAS
jgi:hypothetical protein